MASISIQLDGSTFRRLNKIAPGQKAEFIRQAVTEAVRKRENEQIRDAHLRQPDSAADADDWSSAEEWKSEVSR
jgi:hypothetical protein